MENKEIPPLFVSQLDGWEGVAGVGVRVWVVQYLVAPPHNTVRTGRPVL